MITYLSIHNLGPHTDTALDLDPDGVAVDAEEAGRGDGCEHGGPSAWNGMWRGP